jgi:hypothetical protein
MSSPRDNEEHGILISQENEEAARIGSAGMPMRQGNLMISKFDMDTGGDGKRNKVGAVAATGYGSATRGTSSQNKF